MLSRRRFLALGTQGGLALLAGSLQLAGCDRPSPPVAGNLKVFSSKESTILSAAAQALLPDLPGMARVRAVGLVDRIDDLFGRISPAIASDFKQLLNVLEDVPLLSLSLTPFTSLNESERLARLRNWEHSRLALKRRGFQGLKKLAASAFYALPPSWPEIGYPGPWIGRIDVGTGLDNQGHQPPLNPNVFRHFEG